MRFRVTANSMENYEALNEVLQDNKILKLQYGIEIGTRDGSTIEYLLEHNPLLSMTTIDPFTPYMDLELFVTEEMQDRHYSNACGKLGKYGSRAEILRLYSAEAASNRQLPIADFVFIDGEHTYGSCYTDCSLWYPKIRKGGLLCGHDYDMIPVKNAVNNFAKEHTLTVYHVPYLADIWFAVV
jgi:hypothetical protein